MFKSMAQKLDAKETVSLEELCSSNMLEQEAILRLLVKKGIITPEEFIKELELVKREMATKRGE